MRALILAGFAAMISTVAQASPLNCLTDNIYREARGESRAGKEMVAQVTLNRAGRDPRKICAMVARPYQFSWVHMPQSGGFEPKAYAESREVARRVLARPKRDTMRGATHYHTVDVKPRWAVSYEMQPIAKVGRHLVYKEYRGRKRPVE